MKTSTNPPTATQGTDAAKKIVGRKRSVVTDTLGLLLAVIVMAASATENIAGIRALDQVKATHPTVTKTWVDAGFKNQFVEHAATLGIDAEVVPRNTGTRGFHMVKRRWVVERSLGWLMLHRRLVRDYETLPASSESHDPHRHDRQCQPPHNGRIHTLLARNILVDQEQIERPLRPGARRRMRFLRYETRSSTARTDGAVGWRTRIKRA